MTRVLILPGRDLGPWVPQLLFPAFAAMRRGCRPDPFDWTDVETVDGLDDRASVDWVERQLRPTLRPDSYDAEDDTIVVAKSLGSYAAPLVGHLNVPAVWVTPLLTSPLVREGLVSSFRPFLLIGGTADPHWDGDFARAVTPHVLEIPGADHGLFVPGPLELSASNMGLVAAAAERFFDEVIHLSEQLD